MLRSAWREWRRVDPAGPLIIGFGFAAVVLATVAAALFAKALGL